MNDTDKYQKKCTSNVQDISYDFLDLEHQKWTGICFRVKWMIKKVKVLPAPNMAHRAAPISPLITLGHTSAECSESYSKGLVHW